MLPPHIMVFRLRGPIEDVLVVLARELGDHEPTRVLPQLFARTLLDDWIADPGARAALLAMYEATYGLHGFGERGVDLRDMHAYVRPHLEEALRRGDLVVLGVEELDEAREGEGEEPKDAGGGDEKEEKTWIGIKLVDEKGRPVPRRKYRIKLPNFETREGTLDDKGEARINGIDPGDCEITFPRTHEEDWAA